MRETFARRNWTAGWKIAVVRLHRWKFKAVQVFSGDLGRELETKRWPVVGRHLDKMTNAKH